MARTELTGKIGKPMLMLHGTLDALLPIRTGSDVYARMIQGAGRGDIHRYYTIEAGSHVDGNHTSSSRRCGRSCRATARRSSRWRPGWRRTRRRRTRSSCRAPARVTWSTSARSKPGTARVSDGGGNPPAPTTPGGRVAPRGLTAKTNPGRDRRRPFRFAVSGRLVRGTGADARRACAPGGRVSAQVKRGRRTIARKRAGLKADCTYRLILKFPKRSGKRLAVHVRFHGNRETAPAKAAVRYLRLG